MSEETGKGVKRKTKITGCVINRVLSMNYLHFTHSLNLFCVFSLSHSSEGFQRIEEKVFVRN